MRRELGDLERDAMWSAIERMIWASKLARHESGELTHQQLWSGTTTTRLPCAQSRKSDAGNAKDRAA